MKLSKENAHHALKILKVLRSECKKEGERSREDCDFLIDFLRSLTHYGNLPSDKNKQSIVHLHLGTDEEDGLEDGIDRLGVKYWGGKSPVYIYSKDGEHILVSDQPIDKSQADEILYDLDCEENPQEEE